MSVDENLEAAMKASEFGGRIYQSKDDFHAAFDYILDLLEKSLHLFQLPSYHLSSFVSVTAVEEIAKAHIGVIRQGDMLTQFQRKDPLVSHTKKHLIAIQPTVFMGARIGDVLGKHNCERLHEEANDGTFGKTRMSSLYFDVSETGLITPFKAISPSRAWELLILAIETLDDSLVGYTDYTIGKSKYLDELFAIAVKEKPTTYK